ncbi:hypothetical protein TSUD_336210 [Trifolium subterraneum]|uniref:Uncharacterized protein n=1 Tax=Trifolium subterraneum TaxID=3900 RepID=A0A2Z6MT29_TRISU|nr:hypothetical protein TSUD_336210 [Trifolium subterraneum]
MELCYHRWITFCSGGYRSGEIASPRAHKNREGKLEIEKGKMELLTVSCGLPTTTESDCVFRRCEFSATPIFL